MTLEGKRALVTGGGRGIGRAIAERLAAEGARVVVTGRTRAEIDEVAGRLGGEAVEVDLGDRAALGRAIEAISGGGRVDVLVNNAGIAESAPVVRTSDEMFDRAMAVNVAAPLALTRAFLPAMVEARWGRVVNVASVAGLVGHAYTSAYCASKHALIGLTRSVALEVADKGVTVNAVCPGWVETRMVEEAVGRIAKTTGRSEGDARSTLEKMSPQGRLIEPGEVAHLVMALVGEGGRGIHGQALVVDGGGVMR
ncbi:MAG TPA: SDR family NAD(P)-dependent oxidoreductase [Polyangiaceae bacterium]|nr:SDR family NAD(P)-dependent oxidoreductase [Polyangiaceae bacterium]